MILVSVDGLAGFYLDDAKADMPTVHRLAHEGARASGMVCSFPTVTWPNHTTMATGATPAKHGVIGNSYLDRSTGKVLSLLPDPPDLLSACVVWGPGIKPGTKLGKIQMIDIAPTIASILGVPLPRAEGKPLSAIVGK